jgi:hypothetical protein
VTSLFVDELKVQIAKGSRLRRRHIGLKLCPSPSRVSYRHRVHVDESASCRTALRGSEAPLFSSPALRRQRECGAFSRPVRPALRRPPIPIGCATVTTEGGEEEAICRWSAPSIRGWQFASPFEYPNHAREPPLGHAPRPGPHQDGARPPQLAASSLTTPPQPLRTFRSADLFV